MALTIFLIGVVVVFRFTLFTRPYSCPFAISEINAEEYRHVVRVGFCHLQLMRNSFLMDGSVLLRYYCWMKCLLFLAGDVALNPGPVQFPCTVCHNPVRINQRGIQCDGCKKWTHARCANVSVNFYCYMESQAEFSWFCPSCLFLELPQYDESDSDLETEFMESTVETLPIITDVLNDPISGVRIVHHNIQGLLLKSTDVYQWLGSCVNSAATIYCFSETWIKQGGPLLSVPGYQAFYPPFILRDKTGGDRVLPGSCLFVPEMFSPQHPPLCEEIEKSCTSLNVTCCFFQCRHFKMVVASVYRSPSTDYAQCITDLHTLLPQLFSCSKYVVLAGDFNIDLLKHQSAYNDCLVDFQLVQLVQGPSRVS